VLEAEERVLSNRHDASVAPSNTGVPAAEIDEEDETPDKRRRDDDVSGAQSNAGEAAEMDEGEDEDETPNKRLRYGAAVPPRVTPTDTSTPSPTRRCWILTLTNVAHSMYSMEWKPR
jgi:hypothetical protein